MAKAQLTYWDGHGNAEIIRLTMAFCGEEWEDVVHLDDSGATHMSTFAQLETMMKAGVLCSDQLPLLRIDGLNIVQKMAAVRYLARKHGLYGKDNAEATQIDILAETIADYSGSKDHDKYLPRLERALGGQTWFVGGNPSFVDIMFFKVIDDNEDLSGKLPPSLRANFEATLEKLKVYLGSEKRFPRPGRDGYFDRVKASLPYLGFAGGDGKTPAMACDTWNYRYTASAVIDSDVLCTRSGSLELQKTDDSDVISTRSGSLELQTDWDAVSPHTQARCTFLRLFFAC